MDHCFPLSFGVAAIRLIVIGSIEPCAGKIERTYDLNEHYGTVSGFNPYRRSLITECLGNDIKSIKYTVNKSFDSTLSFSSNRFSAMLGRVHNLIIINC